MHTLDYYLKQFSRKNYDEFDAFFDLTSDYIYLYLFLALDDYDLINKLYNEIYQYILKKSKKFLKNKAYLLNIIKYTRSVIKKNIKNNNNQMEYIYNNNKIIQEELVGKNKYIDKTYVKFHLGAKVRQTVNNYEKNIFNGEIGYITNISNVKEDSKYVEQCEVTFKDIRTGESKVIEYKKNELDQLDLSYAMTVHALQGSGYKTVIGIIDNTHYSLLDTCLLYTLITRAKQRCLLLAESDAFLKCLRTNNNTTRQTWLKSIKKEETN